MAEKWQIETGKYMPRLSALADYLIAEKGKRPALPIPPFSKPPSLEQHVAFSLATFVNSGITVVDQLFDNVGLLWSQGRVVGISGLVRFSLEYWAAVHFALTIITAYLKDGNIEEAARKTGRLTFSGKTPVRLPWGGETTNVAYSVMTLLDRLVLVHHEVKGSYDFLSEASHPNFLQNFYFIMASRVYDNFSNEAFRIYAHEILDRTVGILERAVHGTLEDAARTVELSLPLCRDL